MRRQGDGMTFDNIIELFHENFDHLCGDGQSWYETCYPELHKHGVAMPDPRGVLRLMANVHIHQTGEIKRKELSYYAK